MLRKERERVIHDILLLINTVVQTDVESYKRRKHHSDLLYYGEAKSNEEKKRNAEKLQFESSYFAYILYLSDYLEKTYNISYITVQNDLLKEIGSPPDNKKTEEHHKFIEKRNLINKSYEMLIENRKLEGFIKKEDIDPSFLDPIKSQFKYLQDPRDYINKFIPENSQAVKKAVPKTWDERLGAKNKRHESIGSDEDEQQLKRFKFISFEPDPDKRKAKMQLHEDRKNKREAEEKEMKMGEEAIRQKEPQKQQKQQRQYELMRKKEKAKEQVLIDSRLDKLKSIFVSDEEQLHQHLKAIEDYAKSNATKWVSRMFFMKACHKERAMQFVKKVKNILGEVREGKKKLDDIRQEFLKEIQYLKKEKSVRLGPIMNNIFDEIWMHQPTEKVRQDQAIQDQAIIALNNASNEDIISDLAQLIKHASRISNYVMARLDDRDPAIVDRYGFVAMALLLINKLRERGALPGLQAMREEQRKLYHPINNNEHDDVKKNVLFYKDLLVQEDNILKNIEKMSPNINAIGAYEEHDRKLHANPRQGVTLSIPVIFKVIDPAKLPLWGAVKKQLLPTEKLPEAESSAVHHYHHRPTQKSKGR